MNKEKYKKAKDQALRKTYIKPEHKQIIFNVNNIENETPDNILEDIAVKMNEISEKLGIVNE